MQEFYFKKKGSGGESKQMAFIYFYLGSRNVCMELLEPAKAVAMVI